MTAPPADYDSPWKEALEYYFADFLALLAPWLHTQIDWTHPPVFLDKELQAITRHAHAGRRYADKLVRVQSHTQHPIWILIHIEIQGGVMNVMALERFAERMFQYYHRISDHYPRTLVTPEGVHQKLALISLGVLTASASNKTHLTYSKDNLGACSVQFRFPVVHLASWLAHWDELLQHASRNSFAVVVMAQLQAQQTRKNGEQRLASKTRIMRLMYQHQYSGKDILQLFRLIDWMMTLPAELEHDFKQAMVAIEQEHKVAFVTSIERLGEKRGLEKGLERGLYKGLRDGEAALLRRLLTRKFGTLPTEVEQRLKRASPAQLETWSLNILDAQALDDVFTSQVNRER